MPNAKIYDPSKPPKARKQSRETAAKHIGGLLKRVEDWDCTSLPEDEALRVAHRALKAETITSRQHTALLAALRVGQAFHGPFRNMQDWQVAGEKPLTAEEIDDLCQKINGIDIWVGVRE